jgi:hypothetical protein
MKIQKTIGRKIILTPETYHDEALLQSFLDGKCKFMVHDKAILKYEEIKPETAAGNNSAVNAAFLKGYNKGTSDMGAFLSKRKTEGVKAAGTFNDQLAQAYENGWNDRIAYPTKLKAALIDGETPPQRNGFGQDIAQNT